MTINQCVNHHMIWYLQTTTHGQPSKHYFNLKNINSIFFSTTTSNLFCTQVVPHCITWNTTRATKQRHIKTGDDLSSPPLNPKRRENNLKITTIKTSKSWEEAAYYIAEIAVSNSTIRHFLENASIFDTQRPLSPLLSPSPNGFHSSKEVLIEVLNRTKEISERFPSPQLGDSQNMESRQNIHAPESTPREKVKWHILPIRFAYNNHLEILGNPLTPILRRYLHIH